MHFRQGVWVEQEIDWQTKTSKNRNVNIYFKFQASGTCSFRDQDGMEAVYPLNVFAISTGYTHKQVGILPEQCNYYSKSIGDPHLIYEFVTLKLRLQSPSNCDFKSHLIMQFLVGVFAIFLARCCVKVTCSFKLFTSPLNGRVREILALCLTRIYTSICICIFFFEHRASNFNCGYCKKH